MPKLTSLKIQTIFGSPLRIVVLFFLYFPLFGAPLSLKNTPYYSPKASASIIIFYTSWCPPCQRTLIVLDQIHKEHPKLSLHRVMVDDPTSQKRARLYGLGPSVPLILVADHEGTIVKRFNTVPDKTILKDLIKRLEEGRLENGTLPPSQRIDTWKIDRKGM